MAVPSRNGRHSTEAHDPLLAPDRRPVAPLGSVVIAARDAATTLPHQLRALADQHPACAWEVIVADNGSSDGTLRLVREARVWFPRVRAVDASAVRGAGAARNAGAASARGELLLFCDADDVVVPGWVEAMRRALDATDLVAGRLEWERLNDRTTRRSRALPQTTELQHAEPLPWLTCAAASNLGIRREVFERIGGFDVTARYLQDTDLCWRAQLDGARLAFEPDAVVRMRLRRGLRGAWRQGRNSGMGQRWLVTRYGALAAASADRLEADAPGAVAPAPGAGADGATPGARGAAPPRRGTRSWPRRIVRRGAIVGGEVLRVRSFGDLARLSWNTGFGLGYARGGLPPRTHTPRPTPSTPDPPGDPRPAPRRPRHPGTPAAPAPRPAPAPRLHARAPTSHRLRKRHLDGVPRGLHHGRVACAVGVLAGRHRGGNPGAGRGRVPGRSASGSPRPRPAAAGRAGPGARPGLRTWTDTCVTPVSVCCPCRRGWSRAVGLAVRAVLPGSVDRSLRAHATVT